MKYLAFVLSLSLASAFGSPLLADEPTKSPEVEKQEVREKLLKRDALLFEIAFRTCDLDALADMLTEDFEFYHDKWGQVAASREDFVNGVDGQCKRVKAGTDIKARRELVEDSTEIHLMRGYGVLQMGTHRFYGIRDDGPDNLRETARFTHLWKFDEDGVWRLARVLSFDHVDAPTKNP